jgi:hypothetical protein
MNCAPSRYRKLGPLAVIFLLGLPVAARAQGSEMPRGPAAEAAQGSPRSPVAGSRALSLSVGFPGTRTAFESEFFTLGVQWTDVEPGRTGLDLGVGTLPRVLFEGVLGFGARAALVRPVGIGEALVILPTAGLSLLAGVAEGGTGGAYGLHLGLGALLAPPGGAVGLRPGVSAHRFAGAGETIWLLELGVAVRGEAR